MRIGTYNLQPGRLALMGIVNVTPDSFSDGGEFFEPAKAIDHGLKLVEEGADIIDVGGESSRPGADLVSEAEELCRIIPVIEGIRKYSTCPLSIDTMKSGVAREALDRGANMVNDVSAGVADPQLLKVTAEHRVPICLMHMRGTPQTMQGHPPTASLIGDVSSFLRKAMERALTAGIVRENIIVDPGVGFGKSPQENIVLLQALTTFAHLNAPLLIGTSRKSFMGHLLQHKLEERLEATLATLSFSKKNSVSIFRAHDIAAARRFLDMAELLEEGNS